MKNKKTVPISCRMVRVKNIVPNDKKAKKRELKLHIECSEWHFPCESYSYKTIKETLEKGICDILDLKSVEVKDFMTNIVEYP